MFVAQPPQQAWIQMDISLSYRSWVKKGIYKINLNNGLCRTNSQSENKEFWKAPSSLQLRKWLWNEI